MSKPILEISNLSKKFTIRKNSGSYQNFRETLTNIFRRNDEKSEDFYALKNIDFKIDEGDSFGIIGKNGAGKSTLLKIISRITPPTSGKITCRGRIASLLEVGTGFHPELTGRENIFFNGSILGMKKNEIKRQFDSIVEFSGTERFIDTPLKHFSSGMQLRLAFSVAAFLESEILIIDEVLAVGDMEFQKKCIGKMEDVTHSGRTILFVSHNLTTVASLCKKGIWIDKGETQFTGSAKEAISNYLSSHDTAGSVVQLDAIQNEFIKSIELQILNGIGNTFSVSFDQPIKLKLAIVPKHDLNHISVGFGVTSLEGVPVFTIRSTDNGNVISMKKDQPCMIDIEIPHSLRAGSYILSLGIAQGNNSLYYKFELVQFEILTLSEKGNYPQHNPGIINNPSDWKINTAS